MSSDSSNISTTSKPEQPGKIRQACYVGPYRLAAWLVSLPVGVALWERLPRGNGDLWDVGSHIGNVTYSQLAATAGAVAGVILTEKLSGRTGKMIRTGAVTGALLVGAAVNWTVETRTGLRITDHVAGMFPGGTPDWRDAVYGEVGALSTGLLVNSRTDERSGELQVVPEMVDMSAVHSESSLSVTP
jgi:hypothetical protein